MRKMAKTIASLDAKIDRTKDSLVRLQREYDQVAGELRALQKERVALEERAIIQAYRKSRKTLDEVMTFLRS